MKTGLGNSPYGGGRTLAQLALALLLLIAMSAVQAADYNFTGADVAGCSRAGNVYTCNTLPLSAWNDTMTIANGMTVNVTADVGFGYNHTLKMSGTARLTSKGALNIADVAPANLQISGGYLVAGTAFRVGNHNQTLTANISGASLNIGNGSAVTINGSLASSGTVNIGSHATINGAISGANVYTGSPVRITGNVSAGSSFTLASGSNMVGNIVAPVVRILASNVTVTGNVVASTSLTLESGNKIIGDVSTATLTLTDSGATVEGGANVDKAILGWAGRVTKLITCRSGNTTGNCDCVINNSGYPVNSANGPRCTAAAPAGPHHIMVVHEGTGFSCMPMPVTVYACNNAACTVPYYTAKHTVTLYPGGQKVDIEGGSAKSTIASSAKDDVISVSPAGANPLTCRYRKDGLWVNSCAVQFAPSGFALSALDTAGNEVGTVVAERKIEETPAYSLRIQALTLPKNGGACVPAFRDIEKQIKLSCQYSSPASGSKAVRLGGVALNATNAAASQCDANGAEFKLRFDADGIAKTSLIYADAGKVDISAEHAALNMSTSEPFLFVPAGFAFSNVPTGERAAGRDMVTGTPVRITAVNAAGDTTTNFTGVIPTLSAHVCAPEFGDAGSVAANPGMFSAGQSSFSEFTWSQAGLMRMKASVAKYLDADVAIHGLSGTSCTADPGRVMVRPDHFHVTRTGPARDFYYSGEPFQVTVTAHNAAHATTTNFRDTAATGVTLGVFASGTASANPGPGGIVNAAQNALVPANQFTFGVAAGWEIAYRFNQIRTAPVQAWVGATADNVGLQPALGEHQHFLVRSGRLRLANRFGFMNAALVMPVVAEYWTGGSWLVNAADSFTRIPLSAIARTPNVVLDGADFTLNSGRGAITLRPPGQRASVDVAINLGPAATRADQSCLAAHPATVGANLPWLRSLYGNCATGENSDPSARATFGIFSAESRRIIHVRESFR